MRLVNLQELLDPLDPIRRMTGTRIQDIYNLIMKKGWTAGATQGLSLLHAAIRFYHKGQVRLLADYWRQNQPDLVVSIVPHFNRALLQGLRSVLPDRPFVTILTDMADYPPHFWIEPQEQFFICGTERAVEQARKLGIRPEVIYRASGMIVNPRFYEPLAVDRRAERQRLGLNPDLPTGLVLFGGLGSSIMLKLAQWLEKSPLTLQLIYICGRNEELARQLKARAGRLPQFVETFTAEIPYYMYLSDFFIGKPGPGSISEALLMKLPVIVQCNSATLPQERYNAQWVVEQQVGLVAKNAREIVSQVAEILSPVNFTRYRNNAAAVNNRAVFEIPGILQEILAKSRYTPRAP